jgi:hypothetical protein
MREREASRAVSQLITDGSALGLACVSSETIGCPGRRMGAALCTGSRGQAGGVGGWRFHVISGRVQ